MTFLLWSYLDCPWLRTWAIWATVNLSRGPSLSVYSLGSTNNHKMRRNEFILPTAELQTGHACLERLGLYLRLRKQATLGGQHAIKHTHTHKRGCLIPPPRQSYYWSCTVLLGREIIIRIRIWLFAGKPISCGFVYILSGRNQERFDSRSGQNVPPSLMMLLLLLFNKDTFIQKRALCAYCQ